MDPQINSKKGPKSLKKRNATKNSQSNDEIIKWCHIPAAMNYHETLRFARRTLPHWPVADAPYFVDLVNEELQDEFQGHDFQERTYRVYTTLDMDLQRDAAEAVRVGLKEVDARVHQQRRFSGKTPPDAQVALVALDAQTGEVKALVLSLIPL